LVSGFIGRAEVSRAGLFEAGPNDRDPLPPSERDFPDTGFFDRAAGLGRALALATGFRALRACAGAVFFAIFFLLAIRLITDSAIRWSLQKRPR
jgi:hypothetical protein